MYPSASTLVDPMLSFAKMAAQTSVLFLHQIMKYTGNEHEDYVQEHEKRSMSAAQAVIELLEPLVPFSYFKVIFSALTPHSYVLALTCFIVFPHV